MVDFTKLDNPKLPRNSTEVLIHYVRNADNGELVSQKEWHAAVKRFLQERHLIPTR